MEQGVIIWKIIVICIHIYVYLFVICHIKVNFHTEYVIKKESYFF